MILAALITFIITILILLCSFLSYKILELQKEEMSQRRQVQELADHLKIGRWVIYNIHNENLDQLIAEHMPPKSPR
jgi:predicted Holliday junction resolvase-like endonuclease